MNKIIPTLDPSRDWETLTAEDKRRVIMSLCSNGRIEENDTSDLPEERFCLTLCEWDVCVWGVASDRKVG